MGRCNTRRNLLLDVYGAKFVRRDQPKQNKSPGYVLIQYGCPDRFSIGSVVRSTDYKVLHRPVEPAAVAGNWEPARVWSKTYWELAHCLENIHGARSEQDYDRERNHRLDHHAELRPA